MFVRWGPFLVPPLYLAVIFCLQPADHLGPPPRAPWLERALYDDWDLAALALRGLNASLGRTPGRLDNPDPVTTQDYNRALDEDRPLQPRYFLEYPHAALLLFRLGWLLQGPLPRVPAALCDGSYANIVYHQPRNEAERDLWRHFRWAMRIYQVLMLGCYLALVQVLRHGYDPEGRLASSGVLLLLPATLYFALNRFDVLPALLTALSLACLGRRRHGASGALLAAATMIKVYPVLLAPLVLRYLWPQRGPIVRWCGAYSLTALVFLVPPLLADGLGSVRAPYLFQLTRELDGLSIYDYLLPSWLGEPTPVGQGFRLGCLVLALGAGLWQGAPDLESVLRYGAVVLIVFVSLSVFYSPQWLLWLVPLLLPLTGRQPGLAWLIAALDLATLYTFPFWPPFGPDPVIVLRFVLLGVTAVVLLSKGRKRGNADERAPPTPPTAGG